MGIGFDWEGQMNGILENGIVFLGFDFDGEVIFDGGRWMFNFGSVEVFLWIVSDNMLVWGDIGKEVYFMVLQSVNCFIGERLQLWNVLQVFFFFMGFLCMFLLLLLDVCWICGVVIDGMRNFGIVEVIVDLVGVDRLSFVREVR